MWKGDDAELDRASRGLGAVGNTEFLENVRQMGADRTPGHKQPISDLLIRSPLGDEAQYLQFSG
jgi:hypothetical protein